MKSKRMKITATLVVAFSLAIIALPHLVDVDRLRPQLEASLQSSLDRPQFTSDIWRSRCEAAPSSPRVSADSKRVTSLSSLIAGAQYCTLDATIRHDGLVKKR
jgi:hypothetical protein